MNIHYRNTTESDRAFAQQVHHSAYRAVVEHQFGSWDDELQGKFFAEGWKPGISQIILVDSTPVGILLLESCKDHIKLVEMQILPEYQNRGIGSEVLRQQIEMAKAKGVSLRLQVLKKNKAKELYSRHGFLPSGESDTHSFMELAV